MSFNHTLEHWERAKTDPNSDDKHKLSLAENMAKELKEIQDLLKEALITLEWEVEGSPEVDDDSLLARMRKAVK